MNTQSWLPHKFRVDGEGYERAVYGAEIPELDFTRRLVRKFSIGLGCFIRKLPLDLACPEGSVFDAQNAKVESVYKQLLQVIASESVASGSLNVPPGKPGFCPGPGPVLKLGGV